MQSFRGVRTKSVAAGFEGAVEASGGRLCQRERFQDSQLGVYSSQPAWVENLARLLGLSEVMAPRIQEVKSVCPAYLTGPR